MKRSDNANERPARERRPVLHGDLVAAARALLCMAPSQRQRAMRGLLRAAMMGERHRRSHGRPHVRYGSGSLMSAAGRWPRAPEPFLDDPDYLHCLSVVIAELRADVAAPRS